LDTVAALGVPAKVWLGTQAASVRGLWHGQRGPEINSTSTISSVSDKDRLFAPWAWRLSSSFSVAGSNLLKSKSIHE
jgi:hypothetical protein